MNSLSAEQRKFAIAQNFNRVANTYDHAAILQQEVGRRLLERLDLLTIDPHFVLDLGSGTGFLGQGLAERYKNAAIIHLDIAHQMLSFAKQPKTSETHCFLCADGEQLPLKNHSVDLILSNCVLQWFVHPKKALEEMCRVLKPEGILFFSTFGPDTLIELRHSLLSLEGNANPWESDFHGLIDMHEIGDWLLQNTFSDPVMDREIITLTYENVIGLLRDLKQTGSYPFAASAHEKDHGRLKSRNHLRLLSRAYESYKNKAGELPATFEVIYGHAVAPTKTGLHRQDKDGIIRVSVDDIGYL